MIKISLMLILVSCSASSGQFKKIDLERFTVNEGLPTNSVRCIIQDGFGYIWLGTGNGLVRFDGYEMAIFQPQPRDKNSISGRRINAIFEDTFKNLWVGTTEGLSKFSRSQGSFTNFQNIPGDTNSLPENFITSIAQSSLDSSSLLLGTRSTGVVKFDMESGTAERLATNSADTIGRNPRRITSIIQEKDVPGSFWLGSEEGLFVFDSRTEELSAVNYTSENLFVSSLFQDEDKLFWVGTKSGILLIDPLQRLLREYSFPADKSLHVTVIDKRADGKIWVGTDSGLFTLDRVGGKYEQFNDPQFHNGAEVMRINSVLEDRSGVFWCGTNIGLDKIVHSTRTFPLIKHDPTDPNSISGNAVYSVFESSDGILWIGTREGLNRVNRRTNDVERIIANRKDPSSLSSNTIYSVYEPPLHRGTIWVGTARGLNMLSASTGAIKQFLPDRNDPSAITGRRVISIYEDKSGNLFIGTLDGGLNIFNWEDETFTSLAHDPLDTNSISSDQISEIYEAPSEPGILWMGTWGTGLNRYDRVKNKFTQIPFMGSDKNHFEYFVVDVLEDFSGRLWVATMRNGLLLLDRDTKTLSNQLDINTGLNAKGAMGIQEDNSGNLWISTKTGLVKYNHDTKAISYFKSDDELSGNAFIQKSSFGSKSGELFFGGSKGLHAFFPQRINNPNEPDVVISSFKLFNSEIFPGENSPLTRSIAMTNEIDLDYDENDISFDFLGLHYTNPELNRYAYILENYEESWREVKDLRTAVYTNLEPGEYVFRVKAANSDGVWNEHGASVAISIDYPIWEKWYAFIFYLMGAGGFTFGIKQLIVERANQKSRVRESELKLEAMEMESRAIKAENERKTLELEQARELQLSLLPEEVPTIGGVEIAAKLSTAAEVGGDYYDFLLDGNGTLNAVLGDATGHGMRAGNMVGITKGLFCSDGLALQPAEFMIKSGKALKRMNLWNLYMALTFVRISKGEFVISSAGMPPAYLYKKEEDRLEKISHKILPLGSFEELVYKQESHKTTPGDMLVLLTDGLPETFNSDQKMFGYKRIEKVIMSNSHHSPSELIAAMAQAGESWSDGAPLGDDTSFLVFKFC